MNPAERGPMKSPESPMGWYSSHCWTISPSRTHFRCSIPSRNRWIGPFNKCFSQSQCVSLFQPHGSPHFGSTNYFSNGPSLGMQVTNFYSAKIILLGMRLGQAFALGIIILSFYTKSWWCFAIGRVLHYKFLVGS
jgi:hypothetical protein